MPGMRATMHEFKKGTLYSGSGKKVKKRSQAIAIGMAESRRAGSRGKLSKLRRKK